MADEVGSDPIVVPSQVRNFEVRNLLMRLRMTMLQIVGSQSSDVEFETEADVERVEKLVDRLNEVWLMITKNELDCPYLQPQDFPVFTYNELVHIRSTDMFDVASTMAAWYQEIGRSDSSKTGGAISHQDKLRGDEFITRIRDKVAMMRASLSTDQPEAPDAGD